MGYGIIKHLINITVILSNTQSTHEIRFRIRRVWATAKAIGSSTRGPTSTLETNQLQSQQVTTMFGMELAGCFCTLFLPLEQNMSMPCQPCLMLQYLMFNSRKPSNRKQAERSPSAKTVSYHSAPLKLLGQSAVQLRPWNYSKWQVSSKQFDAIPVVQELQSITGPWAFVVKICQATAALTCCDTSHASQWGCEYGKTKFPLHSPLPLALWLSSWLSQRPVAQGLEASTCKGPRLIPIDWIWNGIGIYQQKQHVEFSPKSQQAGAASPSGSLRKSLSSTLISTCAACQAARIWQACVIYAWQYDTIRLNTSFSLEAWDLQSCFQSCVSSCWFVQSIFITLITSYLSLPNLPLPDLFLSNLALSDLLLSNSTLSDLSLSNSILPDLSQSNLIGSSLPVSNRLPLPNLSNL